MSIKTKHFRSIKPNVLIVGIDVAKLGHVAVIRLPDGRFQKPFSVANNRRGFEQLLGRAKSACDQSCADSTVFALEATGHYGHALQNYLIIEGHTVIGINPAHTKKAKEILDGSPEKSDPKDAVIIADLAAQGRGWRLAMPAGVYAELRRLGKLREQLACERTRYLNRYTCLLDLVFPELPALIPNVTCHTVRCLMERFPTAADIARRQYRLIRRLLWKWSIGHFSEDRCRRIYEVAKQSVGLQEGLDAVRVQMRLIHASLRVVESQIDEVEQAQAETLKQVPYAELLLTIPEMAPVTVATILGETGDLRHYHSAAALIKMAGLNLYTLSSGTFCGRTRITRRGRPLLRRIVYMAALRMSKQGRPLADFRARFLDRLAKPQITIACCRKLLRLIYALVRDESAYQPGRLAVSDPEERAA